MLPVLTVPKPRLVGVTESVRFAATPVPLNVTKLGELGTLLTTETFPVTLPGACGANCTLNVLLVPGFRVSGRLIVLVLNPLPVAPNCVTVSAAVPLFFNCSVCEFGEPIVTLPKFTLDGVMANPACKPAPVTGITTLVPCALLTVTAPVMVSAVVGLNVKFSAAV